MLTVMQLNDAYSLDLAARYMRFWKEIGNHESFNLTF